jgi:hypothetical protein
MKAELTKPRIIIADVEALRPRQPDFYDSESCTWECAVNVDPVNLKRSCIRGAVEESQILHAIS